MHLISESRSLVVLSDNVKNSDRYKVSTRGAVLNKTSIIQQKSNCVLKYSKNSLKALLDTIWPRNGLNINVK